MYQDDVVLSNCLWASMERCRCKSSFKWHSVTCWTCGAHNLFKTIQMSCIYIACKHNHTASVSFTICKVSDTSPSIWEGENLPCWGKKKKKLLAIWRLGRQRYDQVAPLKLPFECGDPATILRLCVKASEAVRGEISLRRWSASAGSIRGVVLANRTSMNG